VHIMRNARIIGLFSFALAGPYGLHAQDASVLDGIVLDSLAGRPISAVHVRIEPMHGGLPAAPAFMVVTGQDGSFKAAVGHRNDVRLILSHLAFAPVERIVRAADIGSGQVLRLAMVPMVHVIPEVTIRRAAPEVVFQRADLHVGDHRVTKEGVWVLAYDRPQLWHRQEEAGEQLFRNARLVLLDPLFNELTSQPLEGEVRRLHRDHRQRVVVDGRYQAWVAELRKGNIALGIVDRKTLHSAILPWTDSIAGHLLGSTRTAEWPAFDHVKHDPATQEQHAICAVQDDFVMQLFRSQYKYMSGREKVVAMDMEKATGVDREVIAGFMTGFQHDPYFKVPYAPLFVVGDTLCVFDHAREAIRRFRSTGEAIDEIPMVHQKERGWKGKLIQDPADGRVFALFAKGMHAFVRSIDPGTGSMGERIELTHPFPQEVQLYGGYAYYVYRPPGAVDRRALYREALR
jgi:hypothetical protein